METKNLISEMLGYKPARLAQGGKRIYITYSVIDPSTGKFSRQRVYVNGIKESAERPRYISDLMKKINEKLREGWNPLRNEEQVKMLTPFTDVLDANSGDIDHLIPVESDHLLSGAN